MKFALRFYEPSDFETLAAFVAAIQEHERQRVPLLESGAKIGRAYADYVAGEARDKDGLILLAICDGKAVGVVCGWQKRDDDMLLSDAGRDHGYVSDLFVEENYRGQGIAAALMDRFTQEMKEKGARRIRVCSKSLNEEAMAFYNGAGFKPYETIFEKIVK